MILYCYWVKLFHVASCISKVYWAMNDTFDAINCYLIPLRGKKMQNGLVLGLYSMYTSKWRSGALSN